MIWIRSQDRRILGSFCEFKIIPSEDKFLIHAFQGGLDAEGSIIAVYSLEKKAVKVLDSLHYTIKSKSVEDEVFIMPSEDWGGFKS